MNRAIILAAGKGTRLLGGEDVPKPLCPVLGIPLLKRILGALSASGVTEVGVVVGFQQPRVTEAIQSFGLDLTLTFFPNPEFEKPNGTSLLKAQEFVTGPTFLLMSDHLWSPSLFRAVRDFSSADDESVLGVDFKIADCPDVDDATKVKLNGDRVAEIHKQLPAYDALDTGVFRITPSLMDALRSLDTDQGCSLSDGVRMLASQGRMRAADVGASRWIDVDTPEMHREAERWLTSTSFLE